MNAISPPPRQEATVSINQSPNGSTNPKLNNSAEKLLEQRAQFEKELRDKDIEMEILKRKFTESQQQSRTTTPAASTKEVQNIRTVWPKYPVDNEPKTGTATRLELANLQAEHAKLLAAETLRKSMESQTEAIKERERQMENDNLQEKL